MTGRLSGDAAFAFVQEKITGKRAAIYVKGANFASS
jgi:hypothetical protein